MALADFGDRNKLTTKTIKYGSDGRIVIQVERHKSKETKLIIKTGGSNPNEVIMIEPGEGYEDMEKDVSKGWEASIYIDEKQIDKETARRKTGLSKIR